MVGVAARLHRDLESCRSLQKIMCKNAKWSLSGVLCLRHTMRSDRRQYAQVSKEDAESQRGRARGGITQDSA